MLDVEVKGGESLHPLHKLAAAAGVLHLGWSLEQESESVIYVL